MTDLTTPAQLDEALRASERHPVVLFKHSRTCPVSTMAAFSIQGLDGGTDPDLYRIVVQSSRGLSDEVARRFGVRHESPQALLIYQGRVAAHWSHGRVRADAVRERALALTEPHAVPGAARPDAA